MAYLIVDEGGELREVTKIAEEDKMQLIDGTLQIIKFEGKQFHWAEIEDEESMMITWNTV